jgi:alpha-beta hydrolase superfamily lysophospholipase
LEVTVAEGTLAPGRGAVESEAEFTGPSGQLYRRTVRPAEGQPWVRLAVVHGYGDHSGRYREFMTWMAERGVACEAVDLRGHGQAAGRRGAVNTWNDYLDDLNAFLSEITPHHQPSTIHHQPTFLLGHSHGGLVVAVAGERGLSGVDGVILTAPFLRSRLHIPRPKLWFGRVANWVAPSLCMPNGLRNEWMSSDTGQLEENMGDPLLVRTATPRWYFGCKHAQREVMRQAERFTLPLLILAGDADRVADHRATYDFIHEASSEDKSLQILHEQLHELLREKDRHETFAFILEWIHDRVHPDVKRED